MPSCPSETRAGSAGGQGVSIDSTHRLPDALVAPGEEEFDRTLRPHSLDEFVGQTQLKEQLSIFLEAAKARGEPCEHVLFAGPPGLGKTSLAGIIAVEMGSTLRVDLGAGHRSQGRHGGDSDRAGVPRRAVHR